MDGVLILNKESGFTSNDAICVLRGILRERRIGHTGTLDPMATGVLPICIGKATHIASLIEAKDKTYEAELIWGMETDTADVTGTVTKTSDVLFDREALARVIPTFTGEISQLPPMYSAVKVNGRRLYDLARAGKTVERKARTVTISELSVLSADERGAKLRIRCSKGTYIRTLVEDIGRATGTLATMSALCRTQNGPFLLSEAQTLDEVKAGPKLLPIESFFADLPIFETAQTHLLQNGNPFGVPADFAVGQRFRAYGPDGFKAVYEVSESGLAAPWKMF